MKAALDDKLHSIWHAKNIEHSHIDRESGITFKIEFEEELAAGLLPLSAEHEYIIHGAHDLRHFMYDDKIECPRKDKDGNYVFRINEPYIRDTYSKPNPYRVEAGKVELVTDDYGLKKDILEVLFKTGQHVIDIDPFLEKAHDYVADMEMAKVEMEAIRSRLDAKAKELEAECEEKNHLENITRAENEEKSRLNRIEEEKRMKARDAEILKWAEDHGSEVLVEGLKRGYACMRRYVKERGEYDLGDDYVLDWNGSVEYEDRSCPSAAALAELRDLDEKELEECDAEVVWLYGGLYVLDDRRFEYEKSEAIRVKYLRNTFYKLIE